MFSSSFDDWLKTRLLLLTAYVSISRIEFVEDICVHIPPMPIDTHLNAVKDHFMHTEHAQEPTFINLIPEKMLHGDDVAKMC